MSYYSGTINYELSDAARFNVVKAYTSAACVQCYVNGDLISSKVPEGSGVEFRIPHLTHGQYVRLLSVDLADRDTNYFEDAYDDSGNRITVKVPTLPGYFYGELWRVYLDDTLVYEREIWPKRNVRIGGRGTRRGYCRGIETYGSGRGNWRGLQRGYEPVTLLYETEMLSPGSYKVEAATVDNAGNESTQVSDTVELNTYPAPATDLTVSSYTQGTDTLVLSFTGSTDIED